MRRTWRNDGLSVVLFLLFTVTLVGQSLVGHRHHNAEQRDHGRPELSYGAYLKSPAFLEATAEKWESEFLAVLAIVVLTIFLRQQGSPESRPLNAAHVVVARDRALARDQRVVVDLHRRRGAWSSARPRAGPNG